MICTFLDLARILLKPRSFLRGWCWHSRSRSSRCLARPPAQLAAGGQCDRRPEPGQHPPVRRDDGRSAGRGAVGGGRQWRTERAGRPGTGSGRQPLRRQLGRFQYPRIHPPGNPAGRLCLRAARGGLQGPTSLAFGSDGNLYVASYNTSSVLEYSGTNGSFIQAFVPGGAGGLLNPVGMVFHNGDLFVASQGNSQILEYNAATGASLGAFVASGFGGLALPSGLTFGPDGNLYVASQGSGSILRYDGASGAFLGTFVSAGSGGLSAPADLLFDSDGNILVARRQW